MTGHQSRNTTGDMAMVILGDIEEGSIVLIDQRGKSQQPLGVGGLSKSADCGAKGAYPAVGIALEEDELDIWVRHIGGNHTWGQVATDFGDGLVIPVLV